MSKISQNQWCGYGILSNHSRFRSCSESGPKTGRKKKKHFLNITYWTGYATRLLNLFQGSTGMYFCIVVGENVWTSQAEIPEYLPANLLPYCTSINIIILCIQSFLLFCRINILSNPSTESILSLAATLPRRQSHMVVLYRYLVH